MTADHAELRGLVDRCLLVGFDGTEAPAELLDWIAEGLGGVILFKGNIASPEQLAALTRSLREAAGDRPFLIAADEEGGDVTRLHHADGAPNPGNLALGHVDDPALTEAVARAIGEELRGVGIDLDLAPVADVNTNPDNPIIGTRSFGSDPTLVARHVRAYARGLAAAGIAGCAKHFPGHGDTSRDSHHELPTITGDLEPHLVPFRAAIDAGVPAILSAHIVFPALDADRPATLSRTILTGLLREQLGFDGVVVTDSLTMDAIAGTVGLAEGAAQALGAGADLLCMNTDLATHRAARDHIVEAVVSGVLAEGRVAEAAGRVAGLALRYAGAGSTLHAGSGDPSAVVWPAYDRDALLHVDLAGLSGSSAVGGSAYVVEISPPRRGIDLTAGSLLAALQRRDPNVEGIRLYDRDNATPRPEAPDGLDGLGSLAADRRVVLVVRDAHRDEAQRRTLQRIRAIRPDAIVVGIGTPYDGSLAPGHYVGTHGGARPNLEAAAALLTTP